MEYGLQLIIVFVILTIRSSSLSDDRTADIIIAENRNIRYAEVISFEADHKVIRKPLNFNAGTAYLSSTYLGEIPIMSAVWSNESLNDDVCQSIPWVPANEDGSQRSNVTDIKVQESKQLPSQKASQKLNDDKHREDNFEKKSSKH